MWRQLMREYVIVVCFAKTYEELSERDHVPCIGVSIQVDFRLFLRQLDLILWLIKLKVTLESVGFGESLVERLRDQYHIFRI